MMVLHVSLNTTIYIVKSHGKDIIYTMPTGDPYDATSVETE